MNFNLIVNNMISNHNKLKKLKMLHNNHLTLIHKCSIIVRNNYKILEFYNTNYKFNSIINNQF